MSDLVQWRATRGDCLHLDWQPLGDDDAPFDFVGAIARVEAEWPTGSWSDDSAGGVAISAGGVVSAVIPAAVTATWPAGACVLIRLRIIDSLNCTVTVDRGRVHVLS